MLVGGLVCRLLMMVRGGVRGWCGGVRERCRERRASLQSPLHSSCNALHSILSGEGRQSLS